MFSDDELSQARAASVLKIAEDGGSKLKKSGCERVGPCPVCGGVDRFAIGLTRTSGTVADAVPAATPSRSRCISADARSPKRWKH